VAGVEDLTGADLEAHRLGKILLGNPEVSLEAKRLAKRAQPSLRIPEVELHEAIAVQDAKAQEREQKLSDELLRVRVEAKHNAKRAELKDKGYNIDDLDKIIVDFGAKDYDSAIKIYDMQQARAEPTAPDIRSGNAVGAQIDMRPDQDWRKLTPGEARRKSADIAGEMISGFRTQRRAAR
jgi:hypothetical protein